MQIVLFTVFVALAMWSAFVAYDEFGNLAHDDAAILSVLYGGISVACLYAVWHVCHAF